MMMSASALDRVTSVRVSLNKFKTDDSVTQAAAVHHDYYFKRRP
jgi:hypothetical protein